MGSNKLAHAPRIDPGATARVPQIAQASQLSLTCREPSLVLGGSTVVGLEFTSFHELGSSVSVDFSIPI